MDLYDCIWQRDLKQEIRAASFNIFLKTDPTLADAFSVDFGSWNGLQDIFKSKKEDRQVFHKVLQDVCHENLFG